MNNKNYQKALVVLLVSMISACATSPKTNDGASNSVAKEKTEEKIIGNIPSGSPFSKIEIGMSIKQVHDIIGEPTDTKNYVTGKAFIPFYYGSDRSRLENFYKGQGRLIFTGSGIGGSNFKLHTIIYDSSENGYNG